MLKLSLRKRLLLLTAVAGFVLVPTAATAFAAGDLRAAADEVAGLNQDLATATAGGLVRLLGVVVAIGVVLMLVTVALRRRRTGRDYTPQP